MRSIAIESYLIDDLPAAAPPGFAVLRVIFAEGVPRELALADGWSVIVQVPTGVARTWLDSDPSAIVASSELERRAQAAAPDTTARAAPRLVLRRGGAPLGALALAAGVPGVFRAGSALLELVPLAWEIRAGAMRGGSPNSARIELAWRSRVVTSGIITGGGAGNGGSSADGGGAGEESDGGGVASGPPLPDVPPHARVIVAREDVRSRNTEFLDVVTHRRMSREEFVAEINAGHYPGYEIRMNHGIATPMSRGNTIPGDNLG